MSDRKLATRYARALLASLPEAASQDAAGRFLDALVSALDAHPGARSALIDPAVPSAEKSKLLATLTSLQGTPKQVSGFLGTVVANRRLAALPTMVEVYRKERERAQGIVSGTLTTATPVGDDVVSRAARALSRLSGQQVRLELRVDPGLLGGAIAQVGSTVYDGSVRTQLGRLGNKISKE